MSKDSDFRPVHRFVDGNRRRPGLTLNTYYMLNVRLYDLFFELILKFPKIGA